jgi:hypothetical protein
MVATRGTCDRPHSQQPKFHYSRVVLDGKSP